MSLKTGVRISQKKCDFSICRSRIFSVNCEHALTIKFLQEKLPLYSNTLINKNFILFSGSGGDSSGYSRTQSNFMPYGNVQTFLWFYLFNVKFKCICLFSSLLLARAPSVTVAAVLLDILPFFKTNIGCTFASWNPVEASASGSFYLRKKN